VINFNRVFPKLQMEHLTGSCTEPFSIDAAGNWSSSEILGVMYTHPFSNRKKFNRRLSPKSLLFPPTLLEFVHVLTSSRVARFSHITLKAKHKANYSLDMCSYAPQAKAKNYKSRHYCHYCIRAVVARSDAKSSKLQLFCMKAITYCTADINAFDSK